MFILKIVYIKLEKNLYKKENSSSAKDTRYFITEQRINISIFMCVLLSVSVFQYVLHIISKCMYSLQMMFQKEVF